MAKIDFNQKLINIITGEELQNDTGVPVLDDSGKQVMTTILISSKDSQLPIEREVPVTKKEAITLKSVAINGLLAQVDSQKDPISQQEKLDRYALALKIRNSKSKIDITSEEVTKIKKTVSDIYSTMVAAQACLMLEGE